VRQLAFPPATRKDDGTASPAGTRAITRGVPSLPPPKHA
jgi:hypothetical protein